MKINFLTNPFKIGSNALMLIFLFLSTGIFAQPQSGTCYFVGETVVNGVNTNDTLPRLFVGFAPGSCRAATINVPNHH
ncbi:MAG: hypothetical protein IPL42_15990 [Saprospiraceae bacterium]|nr:hypothetical protein [Saprospiraceae bacterium]